ncbi:MAG TPA: Rap1a/Tai family immunity protein [Candidatus Sulfotelmatobacter sp.]|nr:Rap1a/Tai family immunity protein [Candidatus Sulfotelmatobacter sp.]
MAHYLVVRCHKNPQHIIRLFLVFSFMLSLPCSASTAAMDGNDMLEKCKIFFIEGFTPTSEAEKLDAGYCAGYFDGVLDSEAMWKGVEGNSSKSSHYCKPKEATKGQVLKIVKKWLDDNPDKLHLRADLIIHRALTEVFPCK